MKIHQSRTPIDPSVGNTHTYETYVENPFFAGNVFVRKSPPPEPLPWPTLASSRPRLPQPVWAGHDDVLACHEKVWEIAFGNFRRATSDNQFISDFSATAFNDATFLWDSAFITLWGRYGRRAWNFQGTLDNFYAKQHPDGFICRQIYEKSGYDCFSRFDPAGTGPNVLAWAEWEYFRSTGDLERLSAVFAPIAAYSRWFRLNRTWPDGSYWATGWSSGMDNQPRIPEGRHPWYEHCHQVWVDACMQAVLSDRTLVAMASVLGRQAEAAEFAVEAERLTEWINANLWSDRTGFYHDRRPDGSLVEHVKSIGAYWALLAGVVPEQRLERFLAHLENKDQFNRVHRVPSLSADTPGFEPTGGYWKGGVWPPTNYMLLRGLNKVGRHELAHVIALNHLDNVVAAFVKTGTLWEYYAPDFHGYGRGAKDFVGWTGLPPVAVLFENVFGIQATDRPDHILWHVRLLEEHGVERYPIGDQGMATLLCAARRHATEQPQVKIECNRPLTVELCWPGGQRTVKIP